MQSLKLRAAVGQLQPEDLQVANSALAPALTKSDNPLKSTEIKKP
jgi:hypothetical protein